MNLLSKVETLMSTDLITVHEDHTLAKVDEIFRTHKIKHLPVVHEGKLRGIISKTDFNFYKKGFGNSDKTLEGTKCGEIMTKGVATLNKDEKINVAVEVFKENLFHAIPIMDGDIVVGIISTHDIMKAISQDNEVTNKYEL
jgi:acetoin utilization protein AcuB